MWQRYFCFKVYRFSNSMYIVTLTASELELLSFYVTHKLNFEVQRKIELGKPVLLPRISFCKWTRIYCSKIINWMFKLLFLLLISQMLIAIDLVLLIVEISSDFQAEFRKCSIASVNCRRHFAIWRNSVLNCQMLVEMKS